MRVMGVDPSLTATGLAMIEETNDLFKIYPYIAASRTIKTKADEPLGDRLEAIYSTVSRWIEQWDPDHVAIEGYAMNSKFQRETMGEVGGVIRLALHHKGLDWVEYQVKSWRKIALGDGNDKTEVRLRAFQVWGWEIKDHNQLEAALVGVAHYMTVTGFTKPRARRLHGSDTEGR